MREFLHSGKKKAKTLKPHSGIWVPRSELRGKGLDVRPRGRSPRPHFPHPHHPRSGATLEQEVERGVDL